MILLAPVKFGNPLLTEDQKLLMKQAYAKLEGKTARITIKQDVHPRTMAQNRWYWSGILATIAPETGHTTEELHEYFKMRLLPREYIMLGDKEQEIVKSTTELTTKEFTDYIEAIRAFAAAELSISIPPPEYHD